jgi:hypothetical protein
VAIIILNHREDIIKLVQQQISTTWILAGGDFVSLQHTHAHTLVTTYYDVRSTYMVFINDWWWHTSNSVFREHTLVTLTIITHPSAPSEGFNNYIINQSFALPRVLAENSMHSTDTQKKHLLHYHPRCVQLNPELALVVKQDDNIKSATISSLAVSKAGFSCELCTAHTEPLAIRSTDNALWQQWSGIDLMKSR